MATIGVDSDAEASSFTMSLDELARSPTLSQTLGVTVERVSAPSIREATPSIRNGASVGVPVLAGAAGAAIPLVALCLWYGRRVYLARKHRKIDHVTKAQTMPRLAEELEKMKEHGRRCSVPPAPLNELRPPLVRSCEVALRRLDTRRKAIHLFAKDNVMLRRPVPVRRRNRTDLAHLCARADTAVSVRSVEDPAAEDVPVEEESSATK
eukprot:2204835-Prymnesium_polylepis.1